MYWKIVITQNSVRSTFNKHKPNRIEIICSPLISENELKNILKDEIFCSGFKNEIKELLMEYFDSFKSFLSMTLASNYLIYQYKMRYYFPLLLNGFYYIIDLEIRKAFEKLAVELNNEI